MKNKILQKGTWLLFIIFLLLGFAIGFFTKGQLEKKDRESREKIAQEEVIYLPAQVIINDLTIKTVHLDTKENKLLATIFYEPLEEISELAAKKKIQAEYQAIISGFIYRKQEGAEQFSITPVTEHAKFDFTDQGSFILEFKNENKEIPLNEVYGVGIEFRFLNEENKHYDYVCGFLMDPQAGQGTID
ncbi:MAG: hypothetical protein MSC57_06110 [Peptoniphilaceae bacterium]|nr:hypothetical protein [Peptoniphilaceae bacterium]